MSKQIIQLKYHYGTGVEAFKIVPLEVELPDEIKLDDPNKDYHLIAKSSCPHNWIALEYMPIEHPTCMERNGVPVVEEKGYMVTKLYCTLCDTKKAIET